MRMLRPAAWKMGTPMKLDAEIPASSYSCSQDVSAQQQHTKRLTASGRRGCARLGLSGPLWRLA